MPCSNHTLALPWPGDYKDYLPAAAGGRGGTTHVPESGAGSGAGGALPAPRLGMIHYVRDSDNEPDSDDDPDDDLDI